MAVLAVAGVGPLGSAALGFGWQAGWVIGGLVGSALLRSSASDVEGPRLNDLSVTSSAYGQPIPIGYGTLRLGGTITNARFRYRFYPGREDRQATATEILQTFDGVAGGGGGLQGLYISPDGFLHFEAGSSNTRPILRVDPDTLREVARFGANSHHLSNSPTRFAGTRFMAALRSGVQDYLLTANGTGPSHLGLLDAPTITYRWHENAIGTIKGVVAGGPGEAWIVTASASALTIHTLTVSPLANSDIGTGVGRTIAAVLLCPTIHERVLVLNCQVGEGAGGGIHLLTARGP